MDYYCSKSKEKITKAEYEYSMNKFGVALSRKEQSNAQKSGNFSGEVSSDSDSSKGLSLKESCYRENMIKGRIAETLIEELFCQLDILCFGMVWKILFRE